MLHASVHSRETWLSQVCEPYNLLLKVWAAACTATHSARLMLAVVLPVLAHAGQGSCLAAEPSGWHRALCSSVQAPLLQLLALQALILFAAFWTLSRQPGLLAGQLKAQVAGIASCFL